jgi:hypothetical protein
MTSEVTPSSFADRVGEPPSNAELLVLLLMDAVTVVGVFTGFLGVGWYFLTPTICCWSVHCAWKALARSPAGTRSTPAAAARR